MIRQSTHTSVFELMSELDLLKLHEEFGTTGYWTPQTEEGKQILNSLLQPELRADLRAWYARAAGIALNPVAQQLKNTLEHLAQEKF